MGAHRSSKRRSAEFNARDPKYIAVNISKVFLPYHIPSLAGSFRCHKTRAAGPTLISKRSLTILAAQASSYVLVPVSITFKQATE